ncbi:MAG: DUF4178 domain-containing protein [Cyanobacteria bacterium P01_F01_bin.53]
MLNLLWLLIIIALVGMLIWYFNGGGSGGSSNKTPGVRQPTIFTLKLGDIVQYDDNDWVIEDKLTYNEDGWEWVEYLLQDGDRIGFLSVDDDDTLEVSFTETVKDCPVENPPGAEIIYRQKIYNRDESGTATLTRQRKPGVKETCKYYDYKGPGDAVLSVEQWSGQTEVSVGVTVRPYQLTFLPGDGSSVYRSDV